MPQQDWYNDDPEVPETKKSLWARASIFLTGLLFIAVGNTFAGDISINSGSSLEFGQGVSVATACDSSITLTPYSTFSNSDTGTASFYFSGFRLSDIDNNACNGAVFTVKAYSSDSNTALTLFNSNRAAAIGETTTAQAFYVLSGQTGLSITESATITAFTVTFLNPLALSSQVNRVTLESNETYGSAVSASGNQVVDPFPGVANGAEIPGTRISSAPGQSQSDWESTSTYLNWSCPAYSGRAVGVDLNFTPTSTDDVRYNYCVKQFP